MRIIVNPAAAGGRAGREWPALADRLASLGLDAPCVFTEAPGHATSLAEEAVASGVGQVVAVGGDGTVCEAAEGLHRAGGGTLALLPLGTGNDAARTLGVPTDFDAAVATVLSGRPAPVDLMAIGEHVVLNAIGVGLTADVNRRAANVKFMRGIVVYLAAAVASMIRYPAPVVHLRTPEDQYHGEMTLLAVHNGPTTGGGFRLTPAARPDDGLLDVALVPGVGVIGRAPRLLAAMGGTLGRQRGTLELQAPWVEIDFDEPLPIHLDGNQWSLEPPTARFEILPGALQVMVPGASS